MTKTDASQDRRLALLESRMDRVEALLQRLEYYAWAMVTGLGSLFGFQVL